MGRRLTFLDPKGEITVVDVSKVTSVKPNLSAKGIVTIFFKSGRTTEVKGELRDIQKRILDNGKVKTGKSGTSGKDKVQKVMEATAKIRTIIQHNKGK